MVVLYACAHMQLQLDICAYAFPYTYQLIAFMYIYIYTLVTPNELPGIPQGHQAPPGMIPRAPGDLQGTPKEPSRTSPSTPIVRTGCAWTIEWLRGWFLGPPDITWSRSGGREVFMVRVGGIG